VCTDNYHGAMCDIAPNSCPAGTEYCSGTAIRQCNADGFSSSAVTDCALQPSGAPELYTNHCFTCGGLVGAICSPAPAPDCIARASGINGFNRAAPADCTKEYCSVQSSLAAGDHTLTLSISGPTATATVITLSIELTASSSSTMGTFWSSPKNSATVVYPMAPKMPGPHCTTSTVVITCDPVRPGVQCNEPGAILVSYPRGLPLKVGDPVSISVQGELTCDGAQTFANFSVDAMSTVWHAN
jgi:hypothetical protein